MTTISQDFDKEIPEFKREQNIATLELADRIKQIARSIREGSLQVRDTVKVLRESGAIEEMAGAIQTAAFAARDTANEVSKVASDLRESGVVKQTSMAIEDTTSAFVRTAETVNGTAAEVKQSMPETISKIQQATKRKSRKTA